jgi:hypothetical protein
MKEYSCGGARALAALHDQHMYSFWNRGEKQKE